MTRIKDIVERLAHVEDLSDPLFQELESDSRAGVVKAITKRRRDLQKAKDEKDRLLAMSVYERQLYQQGVRLIAGIDEVGRGPLAGPVVAAAVILPEGCQIMGLNDSKKIPKSKHESIYQTVLKEALTVGIGVIDENTIDKVNIYEATKLAMFTALNQLKVTPEHLLIDAMTLDTPFPQTAIIKGDAKSISIAAASIVAKVTRDKLMNAYDQTYPGYDFTQNAGYGTQKHLDALKNLGITPIHRKTFEPVKSMLALKNH